MGASPTGSGNDIHGLRRRDVGVLRERTGNLKEFEGINENLPELGDQVKLLQRKRQFLGENLRVRVEDMQSSWLAAKNEADQGKIKSIEEICVGRGTSMVHFGDFLFFRVSRCRTYTCASTKLQTATDIFKHRARKRQERRYAEEE